ncbi:radical SAM/SPASM domain-containing protein [Paenibacillus sp. A14]|uniref:radical SAM/SPASM domain-containing protein n=1 Tax=Paenibacillus sp. A14 TaxID=3119820 RepID=UPI002FE042AC
MSRKSQAIFQLELIAMHDPKYFPYTADGQYYLYDTDTGIVYGANRLVHDAVRLMNTGLGKGATRTVLAAEGGDLREIEECLDVLSQLSAAGTASAAPRSLQVRKPKSVSKDDWFTGKALTKLWLSLTEGCNMQCAYCFGDYGLRNKVMMSEETAKACIDYFFKYAARQADKYNVNFFGGEPLLNKKTFLYAVDYINRKAREAGKSIHYIITTNGTLLDEEILRALTENMMYVNISIDGGEQTHNLHRKFGSGGGTFRTIAKNLAVLRGRRYHNLIARMTLTKHGVYSLREDVEFLWRMGFNHVFVDPVKSDSPELALDLPSLRELRRQFDGLLEVMKEEERRGNSKIIRSITDLYESIDNRSLKGECTYFNAFSLQFTPEGEVYKCSFTERQAEERAGNVRDGIDWERFQRKYAPEEKCLGCWARRLCGGGCYLDRGDPVMCEYAKLITEYGLKYYSFMKNRKVQLKEG